jgi:hypothetical protein
MAHLTLYNWEYRRNISNQFDMWDVFEDGVMYSNLFLATLLGEMSRFSAVDSLGRPVGWVDLRCYQTIWLFNIAMENHHF